MRWKVRLFIFLIDERIPLFWKQCIILPLLSYQMEVSCLRLMDSLSMWKSSKLRHFSDLTAQMGESLCLGQVRWSGKREAFITLFYLQDYKLTTNVHLSSFSFTISTLPLSRCEQIFNLQYYLMKYPFSVLLLALLSFFCNSADPAWYSIPSLRAGQVQCVVSLMTAQDTSTNITDTAFNYYTPLGGVNLNELQYGLSLISYESWMTDTFSFNVTMVTYSYTGAVVRFTVLDNTFFTKAKIHYMVIWRGAVASTLNGPTGYYNMQVIYGCYLTSTLLVAPTTGSRSQTVGGIQTSAVALPQTFPYASLVMKTMIAGLQLKNSVGNNDYVKITPSFLAAAMIQYKVDVQANNLLTFFCVSTVIVDPSITINTYLYNVQYNTYILTAANSGLTNVPYMLRYDGSDRMFFGVSEFNLSMSDTRYLNVQTANISLVSLLYSSNSAMNQLTYNIFFFARRGCTSPAYYDPVNYTCVTDSTLCVNSQPVGSPAFVCKPCHYSCKGCTVGNSKTSCSACPTGVFRNTSAVGVCPCNDGYADVGVPTCSYCNLTLIGCQKCSDNQTCTQCDNSTYTLVSGKCVCLPNYFMASGYCLTYAGCLVATYFNNIIACQTCDTSLNFVMVTSNYTCTCNTGYFYNNTIPTNVSCYDKCGDNITAFGKCDDGNNITGDGCDSTCNIQNGYHCSYNITNGVPGISVCVLKEDITVSYLYAERYLDSNSFKMAFLISPAQSGLTSSSFDKNFNSTLPIASSKVTCDPATSMIFLQGEYLQDLQGTSQTAYISFENMTFYADAQYITFTATGINAELDFDQYTTTNTILQYIVMAEAVLALLVTVFASVVGLKLVGIELLIPIQLIYFTLATIPSQRTYNSVLSALKYSNGFNTIVSYAYTRTYSQNKSLAAMNYETQFLLSTNIMLGIFVFILLWLLVHHFRLKYKQYKLEKFLESNALVQPVIQQQNSVDSEQDREDGEQDQQKMKLKKKKKVYTNNSDLQKQESKLREDHHRSFKVFTFQVDRAYFIFYMILINQMMFGFIIMTLNVPILAFTFPEQINVLVCNFIFFIFIGNIVFISYDQQSNKMIAFTCIKDRYAYIYILLDFIIITALSMTFQESFSTYLICALSLGFIVLVAKERPYSSTFLTLENVVAMYLQIMLFVCLVVLCMIRSVDSEKMSLIFTFLIMGLIAVGQILTIIRVVVKVNFKKAFDDLKNPHKDNQNDKKAKKVIEKNLDLLQEDKNVNMIPPESINGLFAPKEKMVDWQSRNTEEYESMHQRQVDQNGEEEEHPVDHEEEGSENKQSDLNKLQVLKKKLRNNLKMKREQEMLKKGI